MQALEGADLERFVAWSRSRGNDDVAEALAKGRLVLVLSGADLRLTTAVAWEALRAWARLGDPGSFGEFWGTYDGTHWEPSLESAVRLGSRSRRQRIVVNDQAAQLFLYGRDIFSESIVEADRALRPGAVAWVCGRNGDVLGLGRVVQSLGTPGAVLKPLADLGLYLRKEG